MADKYTADEVRALGDKGQAFNKADGSCAFPIADVEDLAAVVRTADSDVVRRWVIARAKALDATDKIPDTWAADGSMKEAPRSETVNDANVAVRSVLLDDISIRSGGDGRTVVAYAAIFDTPYEVQDMDGHYMETIQRSCFDKSLAERFSHVVCLYNHGKTLYGTPSERFSMPLGIPLEIRPDTKGLLTVTRYNKTQLADDVLESIRSGEMRSQSFRAQFMPGRSQRTRGGYNGIDTIVRSEAKLFDFGPTPIPVASDSVIVGVRSGMPVVEEIVDVIHGMSADDRRDLIRILGTPQLADATRSDTAVVESSVVEPSHVEDSTAGTVETPAADAAQSGTSATDDTPAETGHLSGPTQEERQRRVRALAVTLSTLPKGP